MHPYKSSPLIQENPSKGRSSKDSSTHRDSNEYQNHKIPNPFLMEQNTLLPQGLLQELSNLEYLTPHQLEKIAWAQATSVPRRSSVFTRHLEAMQRAAREQQQKVGLPKKQKVCFRDQMQIQQQLSLSLEDNVEGDAKSREFRQQWALQPFDIQEQFQLFGEKNPGNSKPIEFYSMTDLRYEDNEWDDYFNV